MATNTNTTKTIFKDSQKSDAELSIKSMKENRALVKAKRVPFKQDLAYAALYPHGFESVCQGIHVRLIFDGSTIELPEFIADFCKSKIEKKARNLLDKSIRNKNKTQQNLGMEYVD